MTKFTVGQRVFWISSNTRKSGVIEGVIPAKTSPHALGFSRVDGGGNRRDHESYVVAGGHVGSTKKAIYWPLVSLLKPADTLTADEIEWCHANPAAVRDLIKRHGRIG
jgi:hypothetical protein